MEQISSLSGTSNTLPCELYATGYCQRITVNFMGQELVTGYDGKHCWTRQGKTIMPTDPITEQRVKEDLEHGLLLVEKLLDRKRKISLGESKIINGVNCPALEVVADDGKPTIFYVDPRDWMIVRSEYHGVDMEQGVDCLKVYDYFDYRKVEGTLQPFKSIEYSDSKKVTVVQIQNVETGVTIPPGFFSMPSEPKISRLSQGPVVIPFQFVSNEILVPVSVNGLPGKLFLLDTGATQSILDTECFQNIAPKNNDEISITTGSGAMKMRFLELKSLKLGDVTIDDVPVAVADLSKFSQLLNVRPQGLIGANVLKRFLLTIDYDRHELWLQDPDKATPPEGAVVVPTKPSLGVSGLAVDGVIDGKLKLTFLIDSGAAFNHVAESLIKKLDNEPILPVGVIKGLDGTPVRTGAVRFNKLEIGDKLKVDEPVFSVAPSLPNSAAPAGIISGGSLAIIGNPLLSHYRVTIDYRNQRIFFQDMRDPKETALNARFNKTMLDFYERENNEETVNQLADLETEAKNKNLHAVAALALANQALLQVGGDEKFLAAYDLAMKSSRRAVMAQVLALWAQHYVERGDLKDLSQARQLIARAVIACPTESTVYAVAGLLYSTADSTWPPSTNPTQSNGTGSAKGVAPPAGKALPQQITEPTADILLNQALMLDPSNWLALWTKYRVADRAGKTQERQLVARYLKRYYPDAVRVKKLD